MTRNPGNLELHSLLARQLKRSFGGIEAVPGNLTGFIDSVNEAYRCFDDDRKMLERSMELSSQELLQANADMRAVLQAFPDMCFRLRTDGTILECKTDSRATLCPLKKMIGKRIQDVPLVEIGRQFDAALRQVRESCGVARIEYGMPVPDGRKFCEARIVYLYEDQALLIVRDVTERRIAEEGLVRARDELELKIRERTEELTRVNASLRQSEKRARTIFNAVQSGILIVDPATHRISDANAVALRMIGATWNQVVGRVCHEHVCPAEKGKCPITDLKNVVDNAERKLLRLDGTFVHVLKTVVQVDIAGRPMLLESFVDISERLRIQQDLQQAKEAAEAANRAKSDFLSNMSHELRTPLTAIIGFAELIQERALGDLTAKQQQYIRIVEDSGRHLLALINEILDLAKVESGKMTLKFAPVAITNLLEHSMTFFKEKCLRHNIRMSLNVPDEAKGLMVTLDEQRIRQVVFNLLSNAVKFTPDGGQIDIEVCIIPNSGPDDKAGSGPRPAARLPALQVSVLDTGVGIPPEQHEKIFEAFYQVHGGMTDKTPGTGLGLALVRQMVELHGGRVWVESKGEGQGSAFRFTIPLQPELLRESQEKALATPVVQDTTH